VNAPFLKLKRCLCCGGKTHQRYQVGVTLDLLADQGLREVAADWLLSSVLGYCSVRCAQQVLVAPLVALNLLGVRP
jgi:hypothetical protein